MERYIVVANFHVVTYPDGPEKAGRIVEFKRSQVIGAADVPEGFDPSRWVTDNLIRPARTAEG